MVQNARVHLAITKPSAFLREQPRPSASVLVNLYPGWTQKLAVIIAIIAVGVVSYLVLLAALPISRLIGNRGRAVFTKIMALLLGAIGIQLIINAIKPIAIEILRSQS